PLPSRGSVPVAQREVSEPDTRRLGKEQPIRKGLVECFLVEPAIEFFRVWRTGCQGNIGEQCLNFDGLGTSRAKIPRDLQSLTGILFGDRFHSPHLRHKVRVWEMLLPQLQQSVGIEKISQRQESSRNHRQVFRSLWISFQRETAPVERFLELTNVE